MRQIAKGSVLILSLFLFWGVLFGSTALAEEGSVDFGASADFLYDPGAVIFADESVGPLAPSAPVVREDTANLVLSPRMDLDGDADGVADGFQLLVSPAVTAEMSVGRAGQRISLEASTGSGDAVVLQRGMVVAAGQALSVSVEATLAEALNLQGVIRVRWRDGSGYFNGGASDPPPSFFSGSARWERENLTVPSGVTEVELQVGLNATGAGAAGEVLLTKLQVEPKARSTAFVDGVLPYGPVISATFGSFFKTDVKAPSLLSDRGTYKMWFEGYDGASSRIGYAESPDLISWAVGNGGTPVRIGGQTSSAGPSVLKDGSTYKMWFYVPSTTDAKIYYATSRDGLDWTLGNGGNAVLAKVTGTFYSEGVLNPCVIKDGDSYRMWFESYAATQGAKIGYATSSDGVTWTVQNGGAAVLSPVTGTFYAYNVFAPCVVRDGNVYRMLFGAQQSSGTTYGIGYATSSDGATWVVAGGAKVLKLNHRDGPAVLPGQAGVTCLYSYDSDYVYLADSQDWSTWATRNSGASVFSIASAPAAYTRADAPAVVYDGIKYTMYFSGSVQKSYVDPEYGRVYYWEYAGLKATSPDGVTWSVPTVVLPKWGGYYGPEHMSVIIEDGLTKCWYSGPTSSEFGNPSLFYQQIGATSGPTALTGFSLCRWPSVLHDGSLYRMWYIKGSGSSGTLCYAESPDGLAWTVKKEGLLGTQFSAGFPSTFSSPRVIRDGLLLRMFVTGSDCKVYYAESLDGLTWNVKNSGAPLLAPLSGTFYAYRPSSPSVVRVGGKDLMWFGARDTSAGNDVIGYAEWTPPRYGAVGMKGALDTTGWSAVDSVSVDANPPEGVRFVFSTDDYFTVVTFRDGGWRPYLEGGWDAVNRDAADLFEVGLTPAELAALGEDELAGLLWSGSGSLRVVALFGVDTGIPPRLKSLTFRYVPEAPATYLVANAHYDSSAWNAINQLYVTLIQPQYAETRFLLSLDGGATLKAYKAGAWTSIAGGSLTQIEAGAATIFGAGMNRNEFEDIPREGLSTLLPSATLDLYAIQRVTTLETTGYKAQFYVDYTEKYVFATRGELHLMLDDGVTYVYDLPASELQRFVEWVNLRERGRGSPFFNLVVSTDGTQFTRIIRRLFYPKIVWFEIREYNS